MRNNPGGNSVGNLILHLCGNVSQWIGHGVAGEPESRDRDAEFAASGGMNPEDLAQMLNESISEATAQIVHAPDETLNQIVEIQGYRVTKQEAILHVLTHFAEHTGQIIFATKLLTGEDLGFYAHLKKPAHAETIP
jgi:uncharacterized damage-inducible protein DinB